MQFRRMTFGLRNAGSSFCSLIDLVLKGLNFSCALAYVDDLVVYSRTLSDHCRDLDRVLTRLSLAGLKAKAEKCQFFVPEIDLLGHKVGRNGVSPEDTKVQAVRDWPTPQNVTEVRAFLRSLVISANL
jgi:hypothetical protein